METVLLVVHLILALALIGVVLMQRSEGGGLGIGGGGGAMTGRSAATALGKVTWALGVAFVVTSLALTIIAAEKSAGSSVLDRITDSPAAATPDLPATSPESLLPPGSDPGSLLPSAD